MSGPFGALAFFVGATLTTTGLRALGEGEPPDVRGAFKMGVRAWLTMVDAATAAQAEFDAFQAEARRELQQAHQPPRDEAPRKISIATE